MKRAYLVCVLFGIMSAGCAMRITTAAHKAFFNPNTLIPLVGAGLFSVDDFDERVSRWATKHSPVYGSPGNAAAFRSSIKDILEIETYVTAAVTSNSQLKRMGVDWAAFKAVHSTTSFLKQGTSRTRPNGTNDSSFPSGCTSKVFTASTLSNRNIGFINMPDNLKKGLQFGNIGLASGVGWSRIESGTHYPSDVLAGAALGHFLSAFIHDVFLLEPGFSIVPFEGGLMVRLSYSF